MTQRGVWQLQRLTVSFCEHSGSSRGAREFVKSFLPLFAEDNKHIEVKAEVKPGRHPCLRGEYREYLLTQEITCGVMQTSKSVQCLQSC
ncbi:TPA: hypothetical protein ACH3X2_012733 [Trebouxia sp. C0005]